MDNVDISVVIPCYNAEQWIDAAIRSVLEQRGVSVEVILVNDGSTDSTPAILEKYSAHCVIVHQANAGVGAARNRGVEQARGRLVRFLDADDILPPEALARSVAAAHSPDIVVVGRTNVITANGSVADDAAYNLVGSYGDGAPIDPKYLLIQATHSSVWTIPREYFTKGLRFPGGIQLGEEYRLSRDLVASGARFVYLSHYVCTIRQHEGNRLSRRARAEDYFTQLREIKANVDYMRALGGEMDEALAHVAMRCWAIGRHCLRRGFEPAAKAHFSFALDLGGKKRHHGAVALQGGDAPDGPDQVGALCLGDQDLAGRAGVR